MTIIIDSLGGVDELDSEIGRVSELLRDLRYLREHGIPPEGVLGRAPVLSDWSLSARPVACLAGHPFGHPSLSGRKYAITSPLFVVSLEQGFARTMSRFWRLDLSTRARPHA